MTSFSDALSRDSDLADAIDLLAQVGVSEDSPGFKLTNAAFVVSFYGSGAHAPLHLDRASELSAMRAYAAHYGRQINDEEFDWGIAVRFADGCEFEWSK